MSHPDSEIIESLGGPAAVARLCDCSSQAVSQWKRQGIPPQRKKYLRLLRPECFQVDLLVAGVSADAQGVSHAA